MALYKLKEFHAPKNMQEAINILGKSQEAEILVLAGGTFLHGLEARGLLSDVEELVDIRKAGLDAIRDDDRGLLIGATVTFSQIQTLPSVQRTPWLAGLSDALAYPPVQIRNTATIGGCVSASCPFFDVPTALLALGATVMVKGGEAGERQLALPDFLAGLFVNSLEPGELVTAVAIPKCPGNGASAFIKLEGNANDLAIVNAAAYLSVDSQKTCTEAYVALGGGVAETAVLSDAARQILIGSKLDAATLQTASEAVTADISPMSDHRASAEYRGAVAKVIVRRTLERAIARLA
ncbi:MAG: FAD binding domain-containing protein [Rhodocyclaceae bacterium]|nr:FAD binding domain-containing protein [Rhodocyclaceae bacterium]MBK6553682.1 FAD binding domain-containing protein [Rhodocyclaceae bacterium]MBK6678383.1 FAD binding domain-containing protein [Rhodocyclaceae bacterium]MBK9311040.1 FAD binding domain-containing protein [Rhodocyclaceae bacterium]MBK9953843.1 FAD binding domain-containing protein [Rhodocyclaceae bacterium]